jgi:hypothetical protein
MNINRCGIFYPLTLATLLSHAHWRGEPYRAGDLGHSTSVFSRHAAFLGARRNGYGRKDGGDGAAMRAASLAMTLPSCHRQHISMRSAASCCRRARCWASRAAHQSAVAASAKASEGGGEERNGAYRAPRLRRQRQRGIMRMRVCCHFARHSQRCSGITSSSQRQHHGVGAKRARMRCDNNNA